VPPKPSWVGRDPNEYMVNKLFGSWRNKSNSRNPKEEDAVLYFSPPDFCSINPTLLYNSARIARILSLKVNQLLSEKTNAFTVHFGINSIVGV